MRLSHIAKIIIESEDDKYVSIGFGRFKLKGKEDDDDADVFIKTDAGNYEKSADQKSDDGGDDKEGPSGQKLGGGDFDRDANRAADDEADDMDRDARFDADAEDDNAESDDIEISDANSGPIDRDDIMDMLKNDSEIMDKLGMASSRSPFEMYWDGMELVSSKFDDVTVASIPDNANMTLGDLKKQIMDFEPGDMDETITINGKTYKPIKEGKKKSNPRVLKEIYDRTFRSLK